MTLNHIPRNDSRVRKNISVVIAVALLIVAVLSLTFYVSFISNRDSRNKTFSTTTGTVVEVLERARTESLRIEYTVDNQIYRLIDAVGPTQEVGNTLQVNYDPSNPTDAQLQESRPAYLVGLWIGMIGGAIGALTFFMLWLGQRSAQRNSTHSKLEEEAKKK